VIKQPRPKVIVFEIFAAAKDPQHVTASLHQILATEMLVAFCNFSRSPWLIRPVWPDLKTFRDS
jgi:hypothetical protein